MLFGDIENKSASSVPLSALSLLRQPETGAYHLIENNRVLHRGDLDVGYAAKLYDITLYHLLNKANNTIALHAGAVVHNDRVILLPGISGAGKSSLTAWLTANGCSYLSDELISITIDHPEQVYYFSRPICLKPGSVPLIEHVSVRPFPAAILQDASGAVVPHRLLNPDFKPVSSPPAIILFPDFQTDAEPHLEPISTARAATRMMGCLVNARNHDDHGFKQILRLAGATTAYRLRYRTFLDAEACLKDIIAW